MPEMDIQWPDAAGFNFLWLQILGYVGWPNNDVERRARCAHYFEEQLAGIGTRRDLEGRTEEAIEEFGLEGEEVERHRESNLESYRKFMAPARNECLAALEEFGDFRALRSSLGNSHFPLKPVVSAGRVLITVRSIETYHRNKLRPGSGGVSLNKAFQVVAKAAERNKTLLKDRSEVKKAWARFRNSAHLAASFLLTFTDIPEDDEVLSEIMVLKFLLIAKDYQIFSTTFTPDRSASTLLNPAEIWSVPGSSNIFELLLFKNRKKSAVMQEMISSLPDFPAFRRALVPRLGVEDLAELRKSRAS